MLAPPRTGVGVGEWLLRATVGTALRRRGKGGGGRGHLPASYAEAPAAPPHAWGQQPPLVEPAGVSGCSDADVAIRQKNCSKVPPATGWRPAPPGFHPRSNWAAAGPPSRMFCLVGSFAFFARYRRARYVGPFLYVLSEERPPLRTFLSQLPFARRQRSSLGERLPPRARPPRALPGPGSWTRRAGPERLANSFPSPCRPGGAGPGPSSQTCKHRRRSERFACGLNVCP